MATQSEPHAYRQNRSNLKMDALCQCWCNAVIPVPMHFLYTNHRLYYYQLGTSKSVMEFFTQDAQGKKRNNCSLFHFYEKTLILFLQIEMSSYIMSFQSSTSHCRALMYPNNYNNGN